MFIRTFGLCGIVCLSYGFSPAVAQKSEYFDKSEHFDKLDQMLKEKFSPTEIQDSSKVKTNRQDFKWIEQSSPEKTAPVPPTVPQKRSAVPPTSPHQPAHAQFLGTATDSQSFSAPRSAGGQLLAQQATPQQLPIAKKDSFTILLDPNIADKPDRGAADVNGLLQKYDLKVVKPPRSGRIEVEPRYKLPEAPTDAPIRIEDILEPKIIKELRKEPIVEDAYVNSVISNNVLPQPVRTVVQKDGRTYRWSWSSTGSATEGPYDGNWGLKSFRMPPVWTIIHRYRRERPNAPRPKVAVIDSGFTEHSRLKFANALANVLSASTESSCELAHGIHVAGIIAGASVNSEGIDGVIPQAIIDAVAIKADFFFDSLVNSANERWLSRMRIFNDVVDDTEDYLVSNQASALRVANVSLGYNWFRVIKQDPGTIPEVVRHLEAQAKTVQRMARRYANVLFVVAAGNDSQGRPMPLSANWSSPFAWAGTKAWAASPSSPNILVVEASDRDDGRADFSNIGGHVAAPGVDILSTLGPGRDLYGVCSGTSQAAPHVAGLATLLFELNPEKTAAEVAQVLKDTAMPARDQRAAPRVDALEAVLRVAPDALRLLADLNEDGKVDEKDLAEFKRQLVLIAKRKADGTPFRDDLNRDGVVDANECFWPLSDLNGSGEVSLAPSDARRILGVNRTDLQVLELAWTSTSNPFPNALAAAQLTPIPTGPAANAGGAPPDACR
jgi:subtilase family protein/dockerin type I repeat protein